MLHKSGESTCVGRKFEGDLNTPGTRNEGVAGGGGCTVPRCIHSSNGAGVRYSRKERALNAIGSRGEGGGTGKELRGNGSSARAGEGHLVAQNGTTAIGGRRLPGQYGSTSRRHIRGPGRSSAGGGARHSRGRPDEYMIYARCEHEPAACTTNNYSFKVMEEERRKRILRLEGRQRVEMWVRERGKVRERRKVRATQPGMARQLGKVRQGEGRWA